MTLKELYTELQKLSIPVAYHEFEAPQKPPFVVYFETNVDTVTADSVVVYSSSNIEIHFISILRDFKTESEIEQILYDNAIPWERSLERNKTEKVWDTTYEITI